MYLQSREQLDRVSAALYIMTKYGRNLLKPLATRPQQWRSVMFSNNIFRNKVDVVRVSDICETTVIFVKLVSYLWNHCDICETSAIFANPLWYLWNHCDIYEISVIFLKPLIFAKPLWYLWNQSDICETKVIFAKPLWYLWNQCDICEIKVTSVKQCHYELYFHPTHSPKRSEINICFPGMKI